MVVLLPLLMLVRVLVPVIVLVPVVAMLPLAQCRLVHVLMQPPVLVARTWMLGLLAVAPLMPPLSRSLLPLLVVHAWASLDPAMTLMLVNLIRHRRLDRLHRLALQPGTEL